MKEVFYLASSSQKKANRKYGENCTSKSVKFTPNELSEVQRIEQYLFSTRQTFSGLVKQLLLEHIEKEGKMAEYQVVSNRDRICNMSFEYRPFYILTEEDDEPLIDFLYETFGAKTIDKFFNNLLEEMNDTIHDNLEHIDYDEYPIAGWIEEVIKENVKNDFYKDMTQEEIVEILEDSLYYYACGSHKFRKYEDKK